MDLKKVKKILSICVIIALVVICSRIIVRAFIDETNSVRIDAESIENSTLIIGTHLIYIGSMNDSIYEVAQKSAENSAQYNMYYKSELADGTWYDITNAFSLEDITTGGIPVESKVIESLNITHHTKSDGITYDLVGEKTVAVCDIYSPYDLEGLEELSPLKIQYENLEANEEKNETDKRNIQYIVDFYSLDFSDDNTKECDENINALHKYLQILVQDEGEANIRDMVQSVIDKFDARRRAQIFANMQEDSIDRMIKAVSRNKTYLEGDILDADISGEIGEIPENSEEIIEEEDEVSSEIDGFIVDNNLLTALSEVTANIEESYNTYLNKMLDEGTTVLSKTEYNETIKLVDYAKENDWAKCDEQIEKLIIIGSINTSTIKNPVVEIKYIEDALIPAAHEAYNAALSGGVGEEYKKLPITSANATKQKALNNQKIEIEKIRNEYQFILKAKLSRLEIEEAIEYTKNLIDDSSSYFDGIKDDAFQEYAASSLESYIEWLKNELTTFESTLGAGEMDTLLAEKEKLQNEKMSALDENNLDKAKEIDAKIQAIDMKISDLERNLNSIINSSTATEAEKAAAKAALGSGTVTKAIQLMLDEVVEDIKDGDLEDIENRLDAICGFAGTNPQTVMNALTSIYEELGKQKLMNESASDDIDDLLKATENIVTENMDAFVNELSESDICTALAAYFNLDTGSGSGSGSGMGSGSGTGSGSGSGSGSGTGLGSGSDSDSSISLDDLLGGDNAVLGEKDQSLALAALAMYYQDNLSADIKDMVDKYATIKAKEDNPYVFEVYEQDLTAEYVKVDKLAKLKEYRYIFNASQKEATIEKGSNHYTFTAFSDIVKRPDDKEEKMDYAAGYQDTIYIHSSYVSGEFGIEIKNLSDSGYAVMLESEEMRKAEELYDILVEIGGLE